MASTVNSKSDTDAKRAFKRELESRGYSNVQIIRSPADIRATKNNKEHFFELKVTSKAKVYFGAATITEWEAALQDPAHFRFVIARNIKDTWSFLEFTPDEFIRYSDIPPFKIYFRIPLDKRESHGVATKRKIAISATRENLEELILFRKKLKQAHIKGS